MKSIAALVAILFSLATTSVWACPGDKAKDDGKQPAQPKPTTSLTIE
jgi:hypothetical protein